MLIKTKAIPSKENSIIWKYFLETPVSSLHAFSGREVLPLTTSTWTRAPYYNEMWSC